jgi:branched-subunit amino acid aminotransferase/4-amino-4-deoxychorismate lyase
MSSLSAYLNGRWSAAAELSIGVDDLGFLMGATVADRLRTFRGQIFRLNEHLRRLHRSLEIVGLPADEICAQVASAAPEFLERNAACIQPDDDWSIIVFATPGVSGRGTPTVGVHGFPLPFQLWAERYETGLPVIISDVRQIPPECLPPELKCRSRMHFYLADQRAAAVQHGARAILLDDQGGVAEATNANVLVYLQNEGLISPPRDRILFGVSLGVVQELAAKLNIPFITRPLAAHELRSAHEAMLASTSVCLLPITQCDGKRIGDGCPGPIFRRLLEAWSELVGVDIAQQACRCAPRRT